MNLNLKLHYLPFYLALMIFGSGCHAAPDRQQLEHLEKELSATKVELGRLAARVDKLSDEVFLAASPAEGTKQAGPPNRLKVVKLAPREQNQNTQEKAAAGGQGDGRDGNYQSFEPSGQAMDTDIPPPAKTLYDEAYHLFQEGKFDDAEVLFMKFLNYYPVHENSDNAYYWIGESRFARADFQGALEAFTGVLEKYPKGNKVQDAMFKMAQCQQKLGNQDEAIKVFKELALKFPQTIAGKKARALLMDMAKEQGESSR